MNAMPRMPQSTTPLCYGHAVCTNRSNKARGRRLSSPGLARMSLLPP
jgi:hypothetical protein